MKLLFAIVLGLVSSYASSACYYDIAAYKGNCGDYDVMVVACKNYIGNGAYNTAYYNSCARPEYIAMAPDFYCPSIGNSIEYTKVCDGEGALPPPKDQKPNMCPPRLPGSIVYGDERVLSEEVEVTGTDFSLVYSSAKVKGRKEWNSFSLPNSIQMSRNPSLLFDNLEINIGNRVISF